MWLLAREQQMDEGWQHLLSRPFFEVADKKIIHLFNNLLTDFLCLLMEI